MLDLRRLKQARLNAGFTQEEVATRLGYKSENTISNWESGIRKIKVDDLQKLITLYGVSFEWIYGAGEDDTHSIKVDKRELDLIRHFRNAPEREKNIVENILKTLLNTGN